MSFDLRREAWSDEDFQAQYEWYLIQAGEEIAERFLKALEDTLKLLQERPDLGRRRRFRHPALRNLRSFQVARPFERILIFYRLTESTVEIFRIMDGMRDLPHRLVEPPNL
jgi:plasmid stabilization system protein ParE